METLQDGNGEEREIVSTTRRRSMPDETGCHAVLYPAVAEAAGRMEATAIGLIDVGHPAAPNLCVDRVGITYSDGLFLGDPNSPVQESCSIVRGGSVPSRPIPRVVARIALARAVDLLPDAIAHVPEDALPIVMTTWALSRLPPARRPLFVERLRAAGRPVAWVSVEGVGVAPSIPTLGDRRASGHSLVGVAVFGGPEEHADAVGRCWLRGRMLTWFH